jgi:hypothetical protein
MPPPPPPPPQALPEELVEEIFLRVSPDQPACLVRASLASKLWLGILTGTRFRGLYRERHGDPRMLGFVYSPHPYHIPEEEEEDEEEEDDLPWFVATSEFRARVPGVEDWRGWHKDYVAWDCRHGRVLFANNNVIPISLVVWDPITGRRRLLIGPEDYDSSGAAVLCNVTGCSHRACHDGPFQIAFVGLYNNVDGGCVAFAHMSKPEVSKWSKPCSRNLGTDDLFIVDRPPVFIQDALYFMLSYDDYYADDGHDKKAILKYDLVSNYLSLIDVPPAKTGRSGDVLLMVLEDGSLGFAYVEGLTLCLWSKQMGSNIAVAWNPRRVVNLEELLTVQILTPRLIGSVEGSDIVFLNMDLGIYEINLKSLQWKKLLKRGKHSALFPYMSFYNPPGISIFIFFVI